MRRAMNVPTGRGGRLLWPLAVIGFALGACSDSPTEAPVSVPATIQLEHTELALHSIGDTVTVGVRVLDVSGREIPNTPVTWRYEGDPILLPVDGVSGRYTSIATGTGQLVAEVSRGSGGTIEARLPVVVMQVPAAVTILASQNTLWSIGVTETLSARMVDARGVPIAAIPQQVTWTSADPAVARIDEEGRITARTDGVTVVSVSYGGLTSTRTIRVSSTFGLTVCHAFDGQEGESCSALGISVRERSAPAAGAP